MVAKYKFVIFDLDGTLVHTTAEYRYFIVPKALKKAGVNKKVSLKLIDKFWFEGNRNTIISEQFGCDKNLFWKVFHREDKIDERAKYTHVYDDVWETITSLRGIGKKLAITTGAPKPIAKIEVDLLPKDHFDKIISITSTRYKAKPHPESLIGCLKFFKAKPSDAVYIGNSMEDNKYALAAGVDFIFLERREHPFSGKSVLKINSLRELL